MNKPAPQTEHQHQDRLRARNIDGRSASQPGTAELVLAGWPERCPDAPRPPGYRPLGSVAR